jgi:hypothetical protein
VPGAPGPANTGVRNPSWWSNQLRGFALPCTTEDASPAIRGAQNVTLAGVGKRFLELRTGRTEPYDRPPGNCLGIPESQRPQIRRTFQLMNRMGYGQRESSHGLEFDEDRVERFRITGGIRRNEAIAPGEGVTRAI